MTIMGMHKDPNKPRKFMKRSKLKPVSKHHFKALRNYHFVRDWILKHFPKCARCAGKAVEIDHIAGRHGHTGKLHNLVAPRNMQPMCDHTDPDGKQCHARKTRSGNRLDWRSTEMKMVLEVFQNRIEFYLPERMGPWSGKELELKVAIKSASKELNMPLEGE